MTATVQPHLVAYPVAPKGAPNIVVILLDDVGFGQLGCFGGSINTPNIDRLAADGLRYNRFHVTSICSSTRAALLTGRNHHAVGIGATQETSFALPGYHGRLPKSAALLPRILRDNGYNTMAVGKWHLTPQAEYSSAGPFDRWPIGQGFERYYGFLGAETNHWSPELVRDNTPVPAPRTVADGYHLTEDLADNAISMMRDQKNVAPDKPFLCWFATGAVHAPHHVASDWVTPYRGAFDDGWESLRERTFARQLELGVIPSGTVLTPRPSWVQEWSSLSTDEQRLFARYMEVFAGFVSHTDAQIGRVLQYLDDNDLRDNTIVLLMSDNGASSEGGVHGTLNEAASWLGDFSSVQDALEHIDEIGGPLHTNHYPFGWAWSGNSPFQLWKRYSWLGGVRAPLIVRWPQRIADAGAIRSQFVHAVDIAPTLLAAIGLQMPDEVDGVTQQHVDGVDAGATFVEAQSPEHRTLQYFEMHGSRSVYKDGFKATTNFVSPLFNERAFITGSQSHDTDTWQLFNLAEDFSESTDIASQNPQLVQDLEDAWITEAQRNHVFPLFDPSAGYPAHPGEYPLPRTMTYIPSSAPIAVGRVPSMLGSFSLLAEIDCLTNSDEGVIAACGDHQGGWVVHLVSGAVHVSVVQGSHQCHMASTDALTPGPHLINVSMRKGANLTLSVDTQEHAHATFPGMFFFPGVTTSAGAMYIGQHPGLGVVDTYTEPAICTAIIRSVTITSGSPSQKIDEKSALRIAEGSD